MSALSTSRSRSSGTAARERFFDYTQRNIFNKLRIQKGVNRQLLRSFSIQSRQLEHYLSLEFQSASTSPTHILIHFKLSSKLRSFIQKNNFQFIKVDISFHNLFIFKWSETLKLLKIFFTLMDPILLTQNCIISKFEKRKSSQKMRMRPYLK